MVSNRHFSAPLSEHLLTNRSSCALLDSFISVDGKGLVRGLNEAAEGVTGWKNADAAGKPLAEVFVTNNSSLDHFFRSTDHSLLLPSLQIDPTRLTAKNGSFRWVEGRAIDLSLSGSASGLIIVHEVGNEAPEGPMFAGTPNLAQR
jgi:PAS domain S-box-containing protein